jgi:hypothetical protein
MKRLILDRIGLRLAVKRLILERAGLRLAMKRHLLDVQEQVMRMRSTRLRLSNLRLRWLRSQLLHDKERLVLRNSRKGIRHQVMFRLLIRLVLP